MINPKYLEHLKKLESKASRGPWNSDTLDIFDCVVWGTFGGLDEDNNMEEEWVANVQHDFVAPLCSVEEAPKKLEDLENAHPGFSLLVYANIDNCNFIAEARRAVPLLLSEVLQLYKKIGELEDELSCGRES